MDSRLTATSLRLVQLLLLSTIAMVVNVNDAGASSTHYRQGTNYAEDPGDTSHATNPGHHWLRVGPSQYSTVSSGGRYHDGSCIPPTPRAVVCTSANGGDYALDIQGSGSANLRVDWAGYAPGFTKRIKSGSNIGIYALPSGGGNYDQNGAAACFWRRFDIYLDWVDDQSVAHWDNMGWVLFGHGANWAYPASGGYIYPNVSRPRDDGGSGTISYLDLTVGAAFNGTGPCSSGIHIHMEYYSNHNWGAAKEHHGYGQDWYYYNHTECPPGNTAFCTGGPVDPLAGYPGPQSVGGWVALLGGNTTSDSMR